MMLLFISKDQSIIGAESSEDASAAAGTEKVSLANWKSARPTWALAGTTAAGAVGLDDWEVSLADSRQAAEAVALDD
jgi:hypothetical protein